MNRWQTTAEPQHMRSATAACELGNPIPATRKYNISKPAPREAPTSA